MAPRQWRRATVLCFSRPCTCIALIETADLVWAVRLAEAGADAAVVDLDVEAFAIMDGCFDRAHRLARRVFAMHAGHRLKARVRVG